MCELCAGHANHSFSAWSQELLFCALHWFVAWTVNYCAFEAVSGRVLYFNMIVFRELHPFPFALALHCRSSSFNMVLHCVWRHHFICTVVSYLSVSYAAVCDVIIYVHYMPRMVCHHDVRFDGNGVGLSPWCQVCHHDINFPTKHCASGKVYESLPWVLAFFTCLDSFAQNSNHQTSNYTHFSQPSYHQICLEILTRFLVLFNANDVWNGTNSTRNNHPLSFIRRQCNNTQVMCRYTEWEPTTVSRTSQTRSWFLAQTRE